MLEQFIASEKKWNDWKKFWGSLGVTFSSEKNISLSEKIFGNQCMNGLLIGYSENIAFCYFPTKYNGERITKKSIKLLLSKSEQGALGKELSDIQFLVLIFHASRGEILVGIDITNKQHPKITTALMDTAGYTDPEGQVRYKNRTLIEQLTNLKTFTGGGVRQISLRAMKKFFEKEALTIDFYQTYKTELFDKIKTGLVRTHGKAEEEVINNFILINLNRLLFIHFLDRKGGIFPEYDKKWGSYISYLFHDVYKTSGGEKSFYELLLKPLFFDVFSRPQFERQIAHIDYLYSNFYDLPYLNGGLFKESHDERSNPMIIDNGSIKTFITQIIDQYNFTITEDTPLEVNVAVDPELLGYIFENLIQEYDAEQAEKKSKKEKKEKRTNQRSKGGIFYTPKIEVDFMCRQVLLEWLAKDENLKDNKQDLYQLFYPEQGDNTQQKSGSFSLTQIHTIFELLESISVVDPACGSGAFLVGMMQVILDIENTLLVENKSKIDASKDTLLKTYLVSKENIFQRKKQLIKHTLHGVDIKSWAVEIAKLRLRLSMIVDAKSESFQGIKAKTEPLLPSFAFKIVSGDSLINRIGHGLIPLNLSQTAEINNPTRAKIKAIAQLKQEFYDNAIKDEDSVWHEEFLLFQEIMLNRVRHLKGERTKLIDKLNQQDSLGMFDNTQNNLGVTQRKKLEKIRTVLSSEIETLESQLNQLGGKQKKAPFARSIAFSDIMLDKGGFDILVGNPPYVRQEDIGDPTGQIRDKKVYKDLCQHDLIWQDRNMHIEKSARIKGGIAVGGRSDLYLYFYFRGLALINERGMFSFITSNSFLDVDFGSSLQEFLIRFCPRIKVIDNAVQRSFASASINTVMVFLDKPIVSTEMFAGSAQFINFSKEYDQVLWSETLAELDPEVYVKPSMTEKTITTGEVSFRKRSNELLRVIDISAIDLWKDGSEDEAYTGNKWGGKYLRAPEIFFTVLEKGGDRILKLKDLADIRFGIKTGVNDFFYLPNKYFNIGEKSEYFELTSIETNSKINIPKQYFKQIIKSPRECNYSKISKTQITNFLFYCYEDKKSLDEDTLTYIQWGEKQGFNKGASVKNRKNRYSVPDLDVPDFVYPLINNDQLKVIKNDSKISFDANLNCGFIKIPESDGGAILTETLSCTMTMIYWELFGIANLGEGAIKQNPQYTMHTLLINPIYLINTQIVKKFDLLSKREMVSIFTEIGIDKSKDIRSQTPTPLPDRKELDDIIFDELGLTQDERNEVYWALAELVKARLDKAKSV